VIPQRRLLPFLALAPAIVVIVGVAAAVAIAMQGVASLREQSDRASALRSDVLSLALAQRLRATSLEDRAAVVERAARRSGAELLLVRQDGDIIVDGSLGPPASSAIVEMLVAGEGEAVTQLGRTRFTVTALGPPLEHLSLLAFVRAPEAPFATGSLVNSVAALTAILVGIAALVAFALARDVQSDVTFVRERIVDMAEDNAPPVKMPIPVRTVDQVGLLTSACNVLIDRFAAAEQAYRHDLAGALAYDKDRSAFLAALSHELRTPLNAILGFTDVLLSEVDGPLSADARESLRVVRTSGDHLRSLIDDILDLSALESGELRLSRRDVDVYAIAGEVVREARVTVQDKPLVVELQGESIAAWADPLRVRQIIGNIVGNAVKFTALGRVLVRVGTRGSYASVEVSDTGTGIAPSEQAAIFEDFRQAGDASARRVGTGLGLAITRRLVQMHGGSIELVSELGKGSRFTVLLPSEPAAAEISSSRPVAAAALAAERAG
jgi:signal transduction histidine kinase